MRDIYTSLAREVADQAHRAAGQTRKGSGAPYIIHCDGVAELVKRAGGTSAMVEAAYLHDTLEDTKITPDIILFEFGPVVLDLVESVTAVSKPEDGDRATRKALDLKHYVSGDARTHTIKLADIIDNLSDISTLKPKFAKLYVKEKLELAEALTKGSRTLQQQALSLCYSHMKTLEGKAA